MKGLLLDMARERSAAGVLDLATRRLAERSPHLALARVWLLRGGDVCETCRLSTECPDQTRCLHLVANAGP